MEPSVDVGKLLATCRLLRIFGFACNPHTRVRLIELRLASHRCSPKHPQKFLPHVAPLLLQANVTNGWMARPGRARETSRPNPGDSHSRKLQTPDNRPGKSTLPAPFPTPLSSHPRPPVLDSTPLPHLPTHPAIVNIAPQPHSHSPLLPHPVHGDV